MKRFFQLISCAALMALSTASFAQTADAKKDKATELTSKITLACELTPEQAGSVKSLAVNYFAELDAIAQDKSTFRTKKVEVEKKYEAKLKELMTADQIVKFDEMRAASQKTKEETK